MLTETAQTWAYVVQGLDPNECETSSHGSYDDVSDCLEQSSPAHYILCEK
jgi:hypothetical protein